MKNIYIADDDIDDVELFTEAAADVCPDVEVTTTFDGQSLLKALDKNVPPPPDLILLDINMPFMDGHEAIEKIKKIKAYQTIPIIIYSTSSAKADIDSMYNAGADYYISKPSDYNGVKSIVKKICDMDFGKGYARPSNKNFLLVA